MRKYRQFVAGFIVGAILLSFVTVFADTQAIEVFFNNIKMSIDGKLVELKDVAGNPVQPFIYNGTTYVPVRAIAEALGKESKFNEITSTIELTTIKEVGNVEQSVTTPTGGYQIIKEHDLLEVLVKPDGTKFIYSRSFMLYLNKKAAREYLVKWNAEYPEFSKTSSVVMEAGEITSTVNFILKHYNGEKIVLMQNIPVLDDDETYLLPYDEFMNNILQQLIEAIKQNQ